MLAVLKTKRQPGVDILEVPEPETLAPNEVLLEVSACGICGSDVHIYRWHEESLNQRIKRMPLPLILGHEIAGYVRKIGQEIVNFKEGDRVICGGSTGGCGRCYLCQQGRYNLCSEFGETALGFERNGGFTRLVIAPGISLHRIPDSISFEQATLIQPFTLALHANHRSTLAVGDHVIVLGPGPVGLLEAMVTRLAGAASVVVAGMSGDEGRLDVAAKMGLETVNLSGQNLVEVLAARTEGRGADLIFDCAGGSEAFNLAVATVRKGGEIVLVGAGRPGPFDQNQLILKELRVVGVLQRLPTDRDRAINLLAYQRLNIWPIISEVLPLAQAQEAFQKLADRRVVKIILKP